MNSLYAYVYAMMQKKQGKLNERWDAGNGVSEFVANMKRMKKEN